MGSGTRVTSHPLIFRRARNFDSETTRKNTVRHPLVVAGYLHHLANGAANMKSEKVLEPFGLQEFHVDGFGNFHLSNGNFAVRRVHATTGARRTHARHRGFQTDHSGGRRAWKQHRHAACSQVKLASSGSGRTAGAPDQEFFRCQRDAVGVGVIQQAAMVRLWNQFAGFRRGIFHAASDTVLITPCPRSRPPWPRRPVS